MRLHPPSRSAPRRAKRTAGPELRGSGVTITASGQNILATASPNGSIGILADGTPRSKFTATFDILTNSVSVDLGDFGGDADTIYLDAFGLGDDFLGEASLLLPASDATMHTLIFNGAGISYVVFGSDVPSINGSSVYADNLTALSGARTEQLGDDAGRVGRARCPPAAAKAEMAGASPFDVIFG
jgi:hypothetical protein